MIFYDYFRGLLDYYIQTIRQMSPPQIDLYAPETHFDWFDRELLSQSKYLNYNLPITVLRASSQIWSLKKSRKMEQHFKIIHNLQFQ